jgi:cation diffusion facilitator CzcD-associated flavoprotein CzcO
MYTFGYSFKTWDEQKSFADGPSILKYKWAADEYKVRDNIIYQQRALCYNFDTKEIMDDNYWKHLNSRRNNLHLSVYL